MEKQQKSVAHSALGRWDIMNEIGKLYKEPLCEKDPPASIQSTIRPFSSSRAVLSCLDLTENQLVHLNPCAIL